MHATRSFLVPSMQHSAAPDTQLLPAHAHGSSYNRQVTASWVGASQRCLPTFLLAGQSNMLGMGLLARWGYKPLDAEEEALLRHAAARENSVSHRRVWSFGFEGSPPFSRQSKLWPACTGWRTYALERYQRMFCAPGTAPLCDDGNSHPHQSCGGPGPEVGFVHAITRHAQGVAALHRGGFGIIKAAISQSSMKHWSMKNATSPRAPHQRVGES